MKATIKLEDYRVTESKVFTGRDRGKDIREKTRIDDLLDSYDTIDIIIPAAIMSINPSFLEEFLFNIVNKLGKESFFKKVKFIRESSSRYNIQEDLEEAIDRILRSNNSLSK